MKSQELSVNQLWNNHIIRCNENLATFNFITLIKNFDGSNENFLFFFEESLNEKCCT